MISEKEFITLNTFQNQGLPMIEIAQRTGKSLATLYRMRRQVNARLLKRRKLPTKHEQYIDIRLAEGVTNATKIFHELQARGYNKTYAAVLRHVHNAKRKTVLQKNVRPSIRFETQPGEQAQVDWGYFGKIEINGRIERLSCFIYVLGYSRAAYIEFTVKQNLQTLEQCHIHAFETLGIPRTIVYDNMKTVVLGRERLPDGKIKIYLNPTFMELAKHYGFTVAPTAPYWPRAKGKVESMVKYVRNNFMQGMKYKKGFQSLDELNKKAKKWIKTYANAREHGTTKEKPIKRWLKEKPFLTFPNALFPYETATFQPRFSTKDGLVKYNSCEYPVPYKYARRKLWVKEIYKNGIAIIEISHEEDGLLATYYLSHERNKWISEKDALFFKSALRKRVTPNGRIKIARLRHSFPSVFRRPAIYYNQVISGGMQ